MSKEENMATNVLMPKLGLTMTEGTVVKWNKSIGDSVKAGEPLVEIETDKINNVIDAPADGLLLKVLVDEGDEMEVSGLLAIIGEQGEKVEPNSAPAHESQEAQPENVSSEDTQNNISVETDSNDTWIKASPAAKKLAKEMDVTLSLVSGTGPDGRIIERDIRAYSENSPKIKASPLAVKVAAEEGINLSEIEKESRIMKDDVMGVASKTIKSDQALSESNATPLSGMRKVIAERMSSSWNTSPHVNMTYEIDMTEAKELKAKISKASGEKYSFTEIITKAVAQALTEHKEINRSLIDGKIVQHDTVNMGIAVALDDGLIVPVIQDAQNKSISVLRNEISMLGEKARKGQLMPSEISGGTFTISNLGMFGVDQFTPIINPPESAILGVCRIVEKPVVVESEIVVRPMMNICLSFDHRIIDGAVAALFMKKLRHFLEQPYIIL